MPICKECHKVISRFDSDVCPHCGAKRPIDDNYKTMDITMTMNSMGNTSLYKAKKRKTMALLCFLLGFAGAHFFYLGKIKRAIASIIITALFVGGLGTILFFAVGNFGFGYLITGIVALLYQILGGVVILRSYGIKDANGELLR